MMMYYYQEGRVRKIVEYSRDSYKLVFEHKDTAGRLQRLYHNNDVEQEISGIQESINALLDSRFVTNDPVVVNQIDDQLREHSRRLFVLEA